jgi:F-type H+-transporting ATPase subunit c
MNKLLWTMVIALAAIFTADPAMAQAAAGAGGNGITALAAGLAVGLAAIGAALAQGRATASAMESIGRNPNSAGSIFTPLLLGLALMEAIALYGFVIAFFLQGKV